MVIDQISKKYRKRKIRTVLVIQQWTMVNSIVNSSIEIPGNLFFLKETVRIDRLILREERRKDVKDHTREVYIALCLGFSRERSDASRNGHQRSVKLKVEKKTRRITGSDWKS